MTRTLPDDRDEDEGASAFHVSSSFHRSSSGAEGENPDGIPDDMSIDFDPNEAGSSFPNTLNHTFGDNPETDEESDDAPAEPLRNECKGEVRSAGFEYTIGSKVDVLDEVDKWSEATVIDMNYDDATLLISYDYWGDKFNEWIAMDSPRVQPGGSRAYRPGGNLIVNQRVEALDATTNKWLEAYVIQVHDDRIRIHYRGYKADIYDEDIALALIPRRIRPFGRNKKINKYLSNELLRERQLQLKKAVSSSRVRKMVSNSSQYDHYVDALALRSLTLHHMEGDGNCLFRSVSHQVYGDDRHHTLVRASCMDYMESERSFFEPYIEGDMNDFLAYLNNKRRNGVWGDDPEIQAMCEIYDRPAEIWSFDRNEGAKVMRTFHEVSPLGRQRPPIRLSYYGGGHYDSVVGTDFHANLLSQQPGAMEHGRIEMSRRGTARGGEGESKTNADDLAAEQREIAMALIASRENFERQDKDLDRIFDDQTSIAMSHTDTEQTNVDLLARAEQSELQQVMDISAREDANSELERALALSAADAGQDPLLQQAIALSASEATSAQDDGDELTRALQLSAMERNSRSCGGSSAQDQELQLALEMSRQVHQSASQGTGLGYILNDEDEDEQLQRAIEESQQGAFS